MLYFHSWSGGKDSTAQIILDHLHGLPPSEIVFAEVMFDNKRNISGELPEHIDFIYNVAIPRFEEWGYKVHVLRSDKCYLDDFYRVLYKSKYPERNGKRAGFPLGGKCNINKLCKLRPLHAFYSQYKDVEITQYVGVAADEPKRLARLEGTNKVSLLQRYGYTEKMAYDLCEEYGLLSPIYQHSVRGGCWFCPNARYTEFVRIKTHYPELWGELASLAKESNLVSQGFKYGETFAEVEQKVNALIIDQEVRKNQISFFD